MAAITLLTKLTKRVQENASKFVLAKKTESSQLNDILGWITTGLLPSLCLAPDIDLIKQRPSHAIQVLHVFLTFPLTPTSIILGLSITLASLSPFSTIPMIQLWLPWIEMKYYLTRHCFLVNSQTYLESFHIFAKSGRPFSWHHNQETARHLRAETLGETITMLAWKVPKNWVTLS